MASLFKKTNIKLELLTDIDMLLMVEKGIRDKDKDKEESFIQYLDANNLYGWAMSIKLPVSGFKWKKIYQNLLKSS